MPVYLPPLSRRKFLLGSVAAASGLLFDDALLRAAAADAPAPADPNRFALLSDVHIAADRATISRKANMAEHLTKVVGELAPLSPRPVAGFVNGDLALGTGESGDYATLLDLLRPVREAGLPLHLTLGNHDHRDRFRAAVPEGERGANPVKERQTYLVESPRANWYVLDSLMETNKVPGTVGEAQLKWLGEALDAHADKPALVMVHHNPDREDPTRGGLTDTVALLDLLAPRKQAKALIFGHTHAWSVKQEDGLHLVNLPAVAYVFQEGYPIGWVDVKLAEGGMAMELRCVDPTDKQHGEKHALKWR